MKHGDFTIYWYPKNYISLDFFSSENGIYIKKVNMKTELRKILTLELLRLSFKIMPKGFFKNQFCKFLITYLKDL